MTADELRAAVRDALTPELLRPEYRGRSRPMAGHCYVASEALFWLLGGRAAGWQPMHVRHEGEPHWFLRGPGGAVVDLTAEQFETPVPYDRAQPRAFMTPQHPSKRAATVIARVRSRNGVGDAPGAAAGSYSGPAIDPPAFRMDWCSHQAAAYACEHWHYSGSLPTPPLVKIGCWERGEFKGVVLFGRGASSHLFEPYGLRPYEGAELVRVAMREHATPVSRMLRVAVVMLRRHAPRLRMLISFADPAHGHVGGIYKASGWVYLGTSAPSIAFRDARGRLWHNRMVSAHGTRRVYGETRRVLRAEVLDRVKLPGKHRYGLPFDDEMAERLAQLAQPYPRGRSIGGDAAGDQPAEGGSTPTRPLHAGTR